VTAWNAVDTKAYSTHADAMKAIAWLKKNYPDTSYLQINHPSRNPGKYTIDQLREMNDLAPDIVFSLEGMVGNQMEPDRGGYTQAANPRRPTWSRAPTAAWTTWWRRWAAPGTHCCPRAATSGTWPTRTTTSP
jgi:hypothetical protein